MDTIKQQPPQIPSQSAPQQPIPQQPKKLPIGKIILSLLAIVVVGELVWAGFTLTNGSKVKIPVVDNLNQQRAEVETKPAQVILQSDKQELKVGDQVKVDILIDTGGKQTDGSDVILNYDPKTLQVITSTASGQITPMQPGKIYGNFPVNSLDSTLGKVLISGISNVGSSFSGQGVLGSVTFKALAAGSSTVAVDFILGNTTDSNIIESGTAKDILTGAKNLNLLIQ